MAALASAWAWPQARHLNSAWADAVPRSDVPASAHRCEVWRGLTATITRPALSALAGSTRRNTPHPASWMDLFRPALADAPFGS